MRRALIGHVVAIDAGGAAVKSHTLLKDRDVQMSWNGELTSASARPLPYVCTDTSPSK